MIVNPVDPGTVGELCTELCIYAEEVEGQVMHECATLSDCRLFSLDGICR